MKSAFLCAQRMRFMQQNYRDLSSEQKKQYADWMDILLENIHEIELKELFELKVLLFWQDRRGTNTLDEFADKLLQDLQVQANNENLSALFFIGLCEWSNAERRTDIYLALHEKIASRSDVAPSFAAAVARHLAQLRNDDISLLKEAAALGCADSAYKLGREALMQGKQDAEAFGYFKLALAQSAQPSKLRETICEALLTTLYFAKNKNVAARFRYYFQLCADYCNDYKITFTVRNEKMYRQIKKGLSKLQEWHLADNAELNQLKDKWFELSKQSFARVYKCRHVDGKVEMDEAVNEIINMVELVLNPEEQIRKQRRIC